MISAITNALLLADVAANGPRRNRWTTPSLEAFRAYALGDEAHLKGNDIPEAEDHYKRALELDPKLAMAWARLGVLRLNTGALSEATVTQHYPKQARDEQRRFRFLHHLQETLGTVTLRKILGLVGRSEQPTVLVRRGQQPGVGAEECS